VRGGGFMPGHRDILPRESFGKGVSAAVVCRDRTIGNFVSGDAAHVSILDADGLRRMGIPFARPSECWAAWPLDLSKRRGPCLAGCTALSCKRPTNHYQGFLT